MTVSWHGAGRVFGELVLTGDTLFEERGWRAFALPRFSSARSPLANTVLLGVLLAAWHPPIAWSVRGLLVPYTIATLASAVVTNRVYYGGRESALLARLYHTTANTAGQLSLRAAPEDGRVTYSWMLAAVNAVAAAAIIAHAGRTLGQRD